jgi:hypothetical protein
MVVLEELLHLVGPQLTVELVEQAQLLYLKFSKGW